MKTKKQSKPLSAAQHSALSRMAAEGLLLRVHGGVYGWSDLEDSHKGRRAKISSGTAYAIINRGLVDLVDKDTRTSFSGVARYRINEAGRKALELVPVETPFTLTKTQREVLARANETREGIVGKNLATSTTLGILETNGLVEYRLRHDCDPNSLRAKIEEAVQKARQAIGTDWKKALTWLQVAKAADENLPYADRFTRKKPAMGDRWGYDSVATYFITEAGRQAVQQKAKERAE